MTENKTVISLYLQKTLDLINDVDIEYEGESFRSDAKDTLIKFVAKRNQINLIPYSANEMVLDTGLLEAYEFGSLVPGGYNSPLVVDNLPTDTQKITLDFQNVKYLVERLGRDETNEKWLTSINDWVEAVSDFQYANKNTGEVFNEYINRLSSIFVRKVLSILALKYGVIPFDKDVIEIIEVINKMHTNLINMKKIKRAFSREEWGENYKGLAEVLRTQTSPLEDDYLITSAGDLFPRGDYQASNASIITKSFYHLLIAQTIEFSEGEFKMATKEYKLDSVYMSMEMSGDNIKEELKSKGKLVYKIFLTLIGYWLNTPPNKGHKLQVSGAEILDHLGQLYPHDAKGGRLTKEIGLNELAEALLLLGNLRVATSMLESKTKDKLSFRVERSALFEMFTRAKEEQKNIKAPQEVNPTTDIEIFFSPGEWFKFFRNYIGYVHKEALSSNEYYGRLLLWITNELGYHLSVNFKIRNILSGTGYHALVESLLLDHDPYKARTLFNTFSNALEKIKAIDNPYPFNYRNPPTWLKLGLRKPTGWFPEWLDVVIVFEKPECLRRIEQEEKDKPKNHKVIDIKAERVEDTSPPNDLEALEDRIKESGVSKRAISQYLSKGHGWLSHNMAKGNLTKKDFTSINKAISVLSKKK